MKNLIFTLFVTLLTNVVMAQGEAFSVDIKLPLEFKMITAANSNVNIRKAASSKSPVLLRYFGSGDKLSAVWSNQVKSTKGTVRLMMNKFDILPVVDETKDYYKIFEGYFGIEGFVGKSGSKSLNLNISTENSLESLVGGYHHFISGPYKGLFIYEEEDEGGHVFVVGTFVDNVPVVFREVNVGITGIAPRLEINSKTGGISYGSAVQGEGRYIDYRKLTPGELMMLMNHLGISGNVEQNCLNILLDVTEADVQNVRAIKYPVVCPTYTRNVHVGK